MLRPSWKKAAAAGSIEASMNVDARRFRFRYLRRNSAIWLLTLLTSLLAVSFLYFQLSGAHQPSDIGIQHYNQQPLLLSRVEAGTPRDD